MKAPLILFLPLILLVGCSPSGESAMPVDTLQSYRVKGVVQKVKAEGEVLVIDHEEIPDYMPQMIMPFFTKEASEAKGLEPGDKIEFDYKVDDLDRSSWIENITVLEKGAGEVKAEPAEPTGGTSRIKVGELFPDYAFLNTKGETVKLSDFRGAPLVFTFVFTRCPVPEYCPAMMHKFLAVDMALKEDEGAPEAWNLLTISFDSGFDTPEVMKAYGKQYNVEDAHWHLLTTNDGGETIQQIAGNVGLKFGESGGSLQHNLRTAVLDADGVLRELYTDETWQPKELLEVIKSLGVVSS